MYNGYQTCYNALVMNVRTRSQRDAYLSDLLLLLSVALWFVAAIYVTYTGEWPLTIWAFLAGLSAFVLSVYFWAKRQ